MIAFARVESGRVRELASERPAGPAAFAATFLDVSAISPQPAVGWTFDGKVFMPPVAPSRPTVISSLQFLQRFTASESTAIHTAALGNAAILQFLVILGAATQVDLAAAATKSALDAMVSAGLIAAGREAELLAP